MSAHRGDWGKKRMPWPADYTEVHTPMHSPLADLNEERYPGRRNKSKPAMDTDSGERISIMRMSTGSPTDKIRKDFSVNR